MGNTTTAQRLLDSLPLLVAHLDQSRTYRFVNKKYLAFFGMDWDDVVGKHISDLLDAATYAKLKLVHDKVFEGESVSFPDKVTLSSGDTYFIKVSYAPDIDEDMGEIVGLFAFIEDITDYVAASELLTSVHEISHNPAFSPTQAITELLELGLKTLNVKMAIVSHINGHTYTVHLAATRDMPPIEAGQTFQLGDTFCSVTLMADGIVHSHHAGQSEQFKDHPCYQAFPLESYIGIPISVQQRPWGTLNFSSPEKRTEPFSTLEEGLVKMIADAVENHLESNQKMAAMHSELEKYRQKAMTDSLTSLPNREAANDFTRRQLSNRSGNLIFAVIDIDHFKQVNDVYGHDVGDDILIEISHRLAAAIRQNDLLSRFGGEEFIMQLRDLQLSHCDEFFERVRHSISTNPFYARDGQPIHITVSIGYTEASPNEDADVLFKRADQAMYQAKNSGRDKVFRAIV